MLCEADNLQKGRKKKKLQPFYNGNEILAFIERWPYLMIRGGFVLIEHTWDIEVSLVEGVSLRQGWPL